MCCIPSSGSNREQIKPARLEQGLREGSKLLTELRKEMSQARSKATSGEVGRRGLLRGGFYRFCWPVSHRDEEFVEVSRMTPRRNRKKGHSLRMSVFDQIHKLVSLMNQDRQSESSLLLLYTSGSLASM